MAKKAKKLRRHLSTTLDADLAEWLEELMEEHEYGQAKAIDHCIRMARAYTVLLKAQDDYKDMKTGYIPRPEEVLIQTPYSKVRREKSEEGDVEVDRRAAEKFLG